MVFRNEEPNRARTQGWGDRDIDPHNFLTVREDQRQAWSSVQTISPNTGGIQWVSRGHVNFLDLSHPEVLNIPLTWAMVT